MDNYDQHTTPGGAHDERDLPELRVVRSATDDAQPAPRMQKRIVEIRLPGDYGMFTVTAWVNFPNSLLDKMQKLARDARRRSVGRRQRMEDDPDWLDDDEETEDAQEGIAVLLSQVIVAHDFADFDGVPYPPATDMQFYKDAPNDLLLVTMKAIMDQVGKLPQRRSGR